VNTKQEHCDPFDPAAAHHGDWWDHLALDPETRLVPAVVPGARDVENVEAIVAEVKDRTAGRVPELVTSDAYPASEAALLEAYGQEVTTTPTGRPSRKPVPTKVPPPGMSYATVEKQRSKGRVVSIITHVVFGTMAAVQAALGRSTVSRGSTCRSWSGRTRPTGIRTRGRCGGRTRSARIGGSMNR
jgi:hypothetical protein